MLRIVTNVAEITHLAHCVALNTLCGITQKVSNYYTEKCQFFAFILEKFTPDRKIYTGTARGARDKYEVCPEGAISLGHRLGHWTSK